MAAVSAMFTRVFRGRAGIGSPELQAYLAQLYLHHPWRDPDIASRVHVAPSGEIDGFIGIMPIRMRFNARPVRGAQAGSLMVGDRSADPLAGARLLRTFFNGPQELSLSETSNPVSQRMWEKLGGQAVPGYSLEWIRVIRPAGFAVALLGDRAVCKIPRPLARGIDWIGDRLGLNPMRLASSDKIEQEDPSDAAMIAAILELAQTYALRPDWDARSLAAFLDHARTKRRHGPLFRVVVKDRRGQTAGCYLYYGRRGAIAYVLQVLARPGAADMVVDQLLQHASVQGCVAVRGRSEPRLQDSLARRQAIFMHRSSLTVHTRDAQLMTALRSGDALVTGLAGEAWSRLIGDEFKSGGSAHARPASFVNEK